MANVRELFDLSGRVAVITGAASGLGRAIALGFAGVGARLALADIDEDALRNLEAEMDASTESISVRTDVSRPQDVQALHAAVLSRYGRADILVNSAGITKRMPSEEFTEDDWDHILAVNLTGTFRLCQAFGQTMLAQGSGSIINFASIGGLVALPLSVAYCASKGGVVQMTKVLGVEWARRGVRVNAIAPCTFDTPIVQRVLAYDPTYRSTIEGAIPMGRMGQPDEIVGAAVFLASDASAMVTGLIMSVDGGYVAR